MPVATDDDAHGSRIATRLHNAVTEEQVYSLTEMLLLPQLSTQRCVEHLSFIPTGGHQWTRDLQISIPDTSTPQEPAWRIVSLGAYARRRFPDFTVVDASGRRLSLLTREQHGFALTQSAVNKLVASLPVLGHLAVGSYTHTDAYQAFWEALYSFFTTSGALSDTERVETTDNLATLCDDVLTAIGLPLEGKGDYVQAFTNELVELLDITRYLCWVHAPAGAVVDLRVTYTTVDPRRKLGRGTLASRFSVLWTGLSEPREPRWKVWADWYRQFGLAPLNYEFSVPGSLHAGSYYFTLEPPLGTAVAYLDWEVGNSLETREVDCAMLSAHIHNQQPDQTASSSRGGTIRAYVHCSPRDHKLIVGTALLNCLFVFLVASGRIHGKTGSPAQSVLLAAPSIYVAYLARQQRHYFADAMRRQRGILWWYLGFSIAFLITLAFGNHDGSLGSRGFSVPASIIVWIWGASSALVAAWYFPLGGSYERVTESLARRKIGRVRAVERVSSCDVPQRSFVRQRLSALPMIRKIVYRRLCRRYDVIPAWKCYQREVRRYSSQIMRLMVVAGVSMVVGLALVWHLPAERGSSGARSDRPAHHQSAARPHTVSHA